jgi:hypothetical protein
MARVRQFAKDMGLSYNQAKNLVNKGRKLRDGGSSVLEKTMNKVKPIKANKGKFNKAKVKKEKLDSVIKDKEPPHGSKVPESMKKYYEEAAKQKKGAGQPGYKNGGFPDLSGDGKTTMKDVLIGRGVIKKASGGPVLKKRAMPKPARFERNLNQPKELVTPFKGILKTSEGEKLKNIDGKTYLVKPNPAYKPKPPAYKPKPPAYKPKSPKLAMRGKKMQKMRGGGLAIQGTQFRGVR